MIGVEDRNGSRTAQERLGIGCLEPVKTRAGRVDTTNELAQTPGGCPESFVNYLVLACSRFEVLVDHVLVDQEMAITSLLICFMHFIANMRGKRYFTVQGKLY